MTPSNLKEKKMNLGYIKPSHITIAFIKNDKEVVFENTKTGKKISCTKKPVVQIAKILTDGEYYSKLELSKNLKIGEADIVGYLKPLIKKGFISDKDDELLFS